MLRGASTITQQLAKNLYLSPSRNPMRKVKELLITRRLEAALSKRRIFEIYLNMIEWGDGIFGCEAAARAYFGKACANLDMPGSGVDGWRDHQPARAQSGPADQATAATSADHPAADAVQAAGSAAAPAPLNESAPSDTPLMPVPSPFPSPRPPSNVSGNRSPTSPPPSR